MSLKVDKRELLISIMLIPFFTYAVGFKWPVLGLIVNVGRVCVLSISVFVLIFTKKINKLIKEPVFIVVLLFYTVLVISSTINSCSIANPLQLLMYGVAPFLVLAIFWSKHNYKVIIGGINISFSILLFLNLVIMIIFPEGIYQTNTSSQITKYFLFGGKNQMVAPIIMGLCIFTENAYAKNGKLTMSTIFKYIICVLELIIGGSGTGISLTVIFFILLFLDKKKYKICKPSITLLIVVGLFFFIIVFEQQNLFSFIIVDILHKDITLTNRTFIWEAAILSIVANPIIGQGVTDGLYGNVDLKLKYIEKSIFSHDMYLDILIMGGLIAMALFLIIILLVKKDYMKIHKQHCFLWWALWLYLVASLFDIYIGNYCLYIVIACILSKKIMKSDLQRRLDLKES